MAHWVVLAFGLALLAGSIAAATHGAPPPFAIGLAVAGLIFTLGAVFERRPDKLATEKPGPGWIETDERFVDTHSGKIVAVFYSPETGERRYVSTAKAE